jgi:hypothetical protein
LKYIKIGDAVRLLPKGWEDHPNIHRTGSVIGMCKLYGWLPGHAFRIGKYIYHFRGGEYYAIARDICKQ